MPLAKRQGGGGKGRRRQRRQLLDNPFLLLFIGVMLPMVVYTLWGVIDVMMIPVAK